VAAPAPAAIDDITFFRTPSGNVRCAFFGPKPASLRCDIGTTDNAPKPTPSSCEFDYGYSYGLTPKGRGRRLCVSDSVADPDARVVGDGHSIKRFGMRCVSKRPGLRCTNGSGHGFAISRAKQRVF
jgi:hypothetical protein